MRFGDSRAFWTTFAFGVLIIPAAALLAHFLSVDLAPALELNIGALLAGAAATAPPVAMLALVMASQQPSFVRFRNSQIEFLGEIGFRFTLTRNVLLSLVAGIGEELLFRGVLQAAAERHSPVWAAILIPNILFAALHARTKLYALAALLIGAYLGLVFWVFGSLVAPIVVHALYDFVALEWARRLLHAREAETDDQRPDSSSGSSVVG